MLRPQSGSKHELTDPLTSLRCLAPVLRCMFNTSFCRCWAGAAGLFSFCPRLRQKFCRAVGADFLPGFLCWFSLTRFATRVTLSVYLKAHAPANERTTVLLWQWTNHSCLRCKHVACEPRSCSRCTSHNDALFVQQSQHPSPVRSPSVQSMILIVPASSLESWLLLGLAQGSAAPEKAPATLLMSSALDNECDFMDKPVWSTHCRVCSAQTHKVRLCWTDDYSILTPCMDHGFEPKWRRTKSETWNSDVGRT